MSFKDFIKWKRMASTWCPGCAIGTVFKQLTFVLDEMKVKREELVVVSGIGCSGRAAGYFNVDSVHGIHGRALPIAEGIKRANRKLKVIVFSGDGDLTGIGGNHLIHTSRRNIDITVVCINNEIYGMTGGQMSPTTEEGVKTLTSPFGNEYSPINIQGIVTSNKRHFYARSSVFQLAHLQKCMREAIQHEGFAFIEVISHCIENNGRRLGFKDAFEMLEDIKKGYKISSNAEQLKADELGILKK